MQVILGHRGMVGSAIHRLIPTAVTSPRHIWSPFDAISAIPRNADVVYLCAAKVGGIEANRSEPAEFISTNLTIQCAVIEACEAQQVKLLVFLGSSCIYPRDAAQPIKEEALLTGPLESTNEAYAIAKIAGIKMLEAYHRQYGLEYLAVMPCNLYGPGDNFDPETSHFLPAMIRKFHDAKLRGGSVKLWGSGKPQRELMHVDDCASIITHLVRRGARGLINIGPGVDYTIAEYADMVRDVSGFEGAVEWDATMPDGTPRKLMDVSRMRSYGVAPVIGPEEGIWSVYGRYSDEMRNEVEQSQLG